MLHARADSRPIIFMVIQSAHMNHDPIQRIAALYIGSHDLRTFMYLLLFFLTDVRAAESAKIREKHADRVPVCCRVLCLCGCTCVCVHI